MVVSVNSSQKAYYQNIFFEDILVVDQLQIGGPLNGILSVHRKFPGKDLYVLACDMHQMEIDVLRRMYDSYILEKNSCDYFVYKNKDYYEPLCGIYTSRALDTISQVVQRSMLTRFSMKSILERGNIFSLDVREENRNSFLNYNEPEF